MAQAWPSPRMYMTVLGCPKTSLSYIISSHMLLYYYICLEPRVALGSLSGFDPLSRLQSPHLVSSPPRLVATLCLLARIVTSATLFSTPGGVQPCDPPLVNTSKGHRQSGWSCRMMTRSSATRVCCSRMSPWERHQLHGQLPRAKA